jgi:ParB/RepB/Spo0J family partition protein
MQRLEQYDVFDIPINDILYDASFNCRGAFTPQSVKDLADSIEQNGLQFPVIVQPRNEADCYMWRLLAGHRRFVAINTFLKWPRIPASIRRNLTEHQARLINLTENLDRRDLNVLEEAKAIRALWPAGVSQRVAAKELKRPTRWVQARLWLLDMPDEVQAMAATGLLSAVNIEVIHGHKTPEAQIKVAETIVAAKKRGKTKFLGDEFRRRFRHVRTKGQINQMITNMLNQGIEGLAPRSLAWAAGYIKDADLEGDIQKALRRRRPRKPREQ